MSPPQGVRFDETAEATGARAPANPADVLARDDELTTSYDDQARPKPGSIVRMDRMLVRIGATARTDLPLAYDQQARQRQPVRFGEWEEMAVVLRYRGRGRSNLELWSRSHKLYALDRLLLRVDVPLRPTRAGLTLFTPAHSTLSLVRAARPDRRGEDGDDPARAHKGSARDRIRRLGRQGALVILLQARCQTISDDWAFAIRRELGDQSPDVLSVDVPLLEVKIQLDGSEAAPHRSPKDVSDLCLTALRPIGEWQAVVETSIARGATFALAWQHGQQLAWIDHELSVDGKARHWEAVTGPAPNKVRRVRFDR